MIRRIALFVIAVVIALPISSQQWQLKRVEAIVGIGTSSIYGDLGGGSKESNMKFITDITFRNTRPSIYTGIRYRIKPNYSAKLNMIYGYSKTSDYEGSRNEGRGFTSVSHLFEISGIFEYYFLPELRRLRSAAMFNRRGMINDYSFFGAYAFIGMGGTFYWPEINYGTPRAGDEYKNTMGVTVSLPLGLGLKYIISDKWIFGYELGYRLTPSDFIDGFISPSSKRPDTYWISAFNLNYRIPTSRRGIPIFLDKQWRRARF